MNSSRDLFFRHVAQTSPEPLALEIVSAKDCSLFAADGREYLDFISGISVSNLGHNHPEINAAVIEQVNKHSHLLVYGEFIQSAQTGLAEMLCSLLPDSLNNVYFVNSGAEAIDGAMKLAKRSTGRFEILSCRNAYHGSSTGPLSIMGSEEYKNAFRPLLPGTGLIKFNCVEDIKHITDKTAAVVIEPFQAEAGVRVPDKNYFTELRKRCNETGTLLILDEVQTGFGRTGKMFAMEHFGFVPDILVLAKALGGGFPLGAFIANESLMKNLTHHPVLGHITTFGGHPVSCAAALASLKVMVRGKYYEQVPEKEKLFRNLLSDLPGLVEFRSAGLLMAAEFESFEMNQKIIKALLENGVLTDWFLFSPQSMRLAPPLIISNEQIEVGCAKIIQIVKSIHQ
ncbi:MAG: aminotransferase class III [Bacteroidetes bacterium GWF2_43_63]|nr:MAG: aminotransferase class III [Bacteroidetes bacterium GWE2_42_42]OFY53423.1 MAG: aminotransferase class III [Bacteroidetes bacterium GWF2_43_63]HBG69404.1 aspartate aminotransferase family protein [Bacteroidales bacterium]HCB62023.1 aspartate aminotransferase family protein [Bacteroidales bacterium]HCY23141.1 aspartate aminotransferase family protein [Bacteroidales bacterium]